MAIGGLNMPYEGFWVAGSRRTSRGYEEPTKETSASRDETAKRIADVYARVRDSGGRIVGSHTIQESNKGPEVLYLVGYIPTFEESAEAVLKEQRIAASQAQSQEALTELGNIARGGR